MKFIYLFIGLFVFFFIPQDILASGEFQADYDVHYAISPTGTTIVTQNITLTNKQTNLYPQKYSIVLDTTKIKNVIAYDSREVVKTAITQENGKTQIILTFNDKVVGIGKTLGFTLRFENNDIAQKNGTIWEVNIPGIAKDSDISRYDVSVSVPQAFGPNAYMSPPPSGGGKWTKTQMEHGGVSAAYGSAQSFDVQLSYFLDNPTITSVTREIALPPDTAYQSVTIVSLDPLPTNVRQDEDGNWLAQYALAPGQTIAISAILRIGVWLYPKVGFTQELVVRDDYIKSQDFWEAGNAQITELAQKYNTPQAIYDFVVSTLDYDYTRIEEASVRRGALGALAKPESAVCMEFSDLFVAIARAAGIPARGAVGYAYTNNSKLRPLSLVADVLHAWPEYYDSDRHIWVPVDPTWAKTTGGTDYFQKMDFNHIVFAFQGVTSDKPYPAGFYRKQGKLSRDVAVDFARTPYVSASPQMKTSIEFPSNITAGFTASGAVRVQNISGVASGPTSVNIHSTPVNINLAKKIEYIPPFGHIDIPFHLEMPSILARGKGTIDVLAAGQRVSKSFAIAPLAAYFFIPIFAFTAMFVIFFILWKRHKKR